MFRSFYQVKKRVFGIIKSIIICIQWCKTFGIFIQIITCFNYSVGSRNRLVLLLSANPVGQWHGFRRLMSYQCISSRSQGQQVQFPKGTKRVKWVNIFNTLTVFNWWESHWIRAVSPILQQNSVSKILYICKYINALPRLIILLFVLLSSHPFHHCKLSEKKTKKTQSNHAHGFFKKKLHTWLQSSTYNCNFHLFPHHVSITQTR